MTYAEAMAAFAEGGAVEIERKRGKVVLHYWPKGLRGPKGATVEMNISKK